MGVIRHRSFKSVAVEEASEFAGFRENATKTTSRLNRLKAITLPEPDDVAKGLRRYIDVWERADEFDAKIERANGLIDWIVYDLYGLPNGEIATAEASMSDD